MTTSREETLLVLRAQSADRQALELLLRRIHGPLQRYLCGLVGREEADDVLQDVLVLVFRNLAWLQDPELFRPWAFRIASRTAFRCLKRRRRWREDQAEEDELEDLASGPPQPGLLADLDVLDVSPASRAVLILHFREELSLVEVAAILGVPVGTAKSRLAYGLAALRRQLEGKRRT